MSLLLELSKVLYDSAWGTALRDSRYAFPVVEGAHLIGLAFSVGLIALTDLRLVGLFLREEPAATVLRQLRPWVLGGFAATFLTGFLLFWAEGAELLSSPMFQLKFVFMLLAGLNALGFELTLGRRACTWGARLDTPAGAKFAGWASLMLWTAVVIFGRLTPYFG